jgi:hypothetical protein
VSAVLLKMVATVADKIVTMHIGDDRVKKLAAQQLCHQFDLATLRMSNLWKI